MKTASLALSAAVAIGVALLGGCDDDHRSYYDEGGFDPSGIYEGTLTDNVTQTTVAITGILDENGNGILSATGGKYFRLSQINTAGDSVFANFIEYSSSGAFANGTDSTTGSLSGSITSPGLQATVTSTGNDTATLSLNYDNIYGIPSSLPTLAGSFTSSTTTPTVSLTINSNGSFTGSDSNACTYNGYFSLIDPQVNAYSETYTLSCASVVTSYTGLADYVPASGSGTSATPEQIHLLADDGSGAFIDVTLHLDTST